MGIGAKERGIGFKYVGGGKMSISECLLWVVLPYSSLAIFIMGVIWQYEEKENYQNQRIQFYIKEVCCIGVAVFVAATGVFSVFSYQLRNQLVDFMIGLAQFNPSIQLLEATSLLFKIHVLSICVLLFILPFTKYIKIVNHIFTRKFLVLPIMFILLGV
jgi:nitrate reductase gamma subunit